MTSHIKIIFVQIVISYSLQLHINVGREKIRKIHSSHYSRILSQYIYNEYIQ